ncbi:hypothetical protein R3P38DRAFT_184840 [Favolaschia claudopus]|uniref:Uncharacterized protein n=1 Tax=Favolaschia claudopus TaxID=2862362 RepID=A0AAW0D215_9AGAR
MAPRHVHPTAREASMIPDLSLQYQPSYVRIPKTGLQALAEARRVHQNLPTTERAQRRLERKGGEGEEDLRRRGLRPQEKKWRGVWAATTTTTNRRSSTNQHRADRGVTPRLIPHGTPAFTLSIYLSIYHDDICFKTHTLVSHPAFHSTLLCVHVRTIRALSNAEHTRILDRSWTRAGRRKGILVAFIRTFVTRWRMPPLRASAL